MDKFDNLGSSLQNIEWDDEELKPFKKNFYKVN